MTKTFDFVMYHNQQDFIAHSFSADKRITRKSELTSVWTINDTPIYTETFIRNNELVDEIDLLQLG